MKYSRVTAVVLFVLAVVALAVPAAAQKAAAGKALVGTWTGPTQVPDQGTDQVTLTVTATDTGLAATIADSLGMISGNTDVKNLVVADNELTGSFALADGTTVALKAKLDGEKLKGTWTHESGDAGEIVMEKKKQ